MCSSGLQCCLFLRALALCSFVSACLSECVFALVFVARCPVLLAVLLFVSVLLWSLFGVMCLCGLHYFVLY